MSKPGDWNCRSCSQLNFQRRDSCQRCGDSRSSPGGVGGLEFGAFGGRAMSAFGFTGSDVRPGDWYCTVGNCGAHNFASRSTCFKCGMFKDVSGGGGGGGGVGGRSSWKSGDWICTRSGCNEHNFASRSTCFRCGKFKDESGGGGGGGRVGGPAMFDTDVMRSRVSGNGGRSSWKSGDWICSR